TQSLHADPLMRHARHRTRLSSRGRFIAGGGALAVLVLGGITLLDHGSGLVIPDTPCASPPPLRTRGGVTLQPVAPRAFRKAASIAHTSIAVSASFRSCAQQEIGRASCRER